MLHPALGHEEDVEQPEKNTKMIRRMDHSGKAERVGVGQPGAVKALVLSVLMGR